MCYMNAFTSIFCKNYPCNIYFNQTYKELWKLAEENHSFYLWQGSLHHLVTSTIQRITQQLVITLKVLVFSPPKCTLRNKAEQLPIIKQKLFCNLGKKNRGDPVSFPSALAVLLCFVRDRSNPHLLSNLQRSALPCHSTLRLLLFLTARESTTCIRHVHQVV